MSFTARHYNEVARIIQQARDDANVLDEMGDNCRVTAPGIMADVQSALRRMFAADNPRFDAVRFDMACEPRQEGTK